MTSIRKWGRPLALVAAFGFMGMTQLGCSSECEDACSIGYEECVEETGNVEGICDEFFSECVAECERYGL